MTQSHLKPFTIESLLRLDNGAISKAGNMELQKIFEDMMDRPATASGKTKPRELVLKFKFDSEVKEDKIGSRRWKIDHVKVVPTITSKLPAVTGGINEIKLAVSDNGHVHGRWNPEIPDDLDQPALFPEEDPLDVK